MIKRYISINSLQLTTTIKVKDKEQTIVFRGGTAKPIRTSGALITDDPLLQVAIESDSSYGKAFISDRSTDKTTLGVKKREKTTQTKASKLTPITQICSPQMALEWIRKNLSLEMGCNTSNREIKKFIAVQGYEFPNLTD